MAAARRSEPSSQEGRKQPGSRAQAKKVVLAACTTWRKSDPADRIPKAARKQQPPRKPTRHRRSPANTATLRIQNHLRSGSVDGKSNTPECAEPGSLATPGTARAAKEKPCRGQVNCCRHQHHSAGPQPEPRKKQDDTLTSSVLTRKTQKTKCNSLQCWQTFRALSHNKQPTVAHVLQFCLQGYLGRMKHHD